MSMLSFIEKFENRSERERGLKMITPKAPLACHEIIKDCEKRVAPKKISMKMF